MNSERRSHSDRRQQDRRQLIRRSEGGWRLHPEGRRNQERRGQNRRTA